MTGGVWMAHDAQANPVDPVAIRAWARDDALDLAVVLLADSQPGCSR